MFAGFKISLNEDFFKNRTSHRNLVYGSNLGTYYDSIGEQIFDEHEEIIKTNLNRYLLDHGTLDASQIEKDWFPQVQADIFLSHSHGDQPLVKTFAGWLSENFGISVFIDSCVWHYADDLLEQIDDKHSIKSENPDGSTTYYYDKTRRSSSHVHMILEGALAKMIDRTECLIFINTPNSISVKQSVEKTRSPWIYNELLLSEIVQRRKLNDYRRNAIKEVTEMHRFDESADLKMAYQVSTRHLIPLTENDLEEWRAVNRLNTHSWMSMDALYKMKGLIDAAVYPVFG